VDVSEGLNASVQVVQVTDQGVALYNVSEIESRRW
jgi:hypothetical protein